MRVNFSTQNFAMPSIRRTDNTKSNVISFEANPQKMLAKTRAYYQHALKEGYAIPAFNVNDLLNVHGIMNAVKQKQSPLIIQASKGARDYAGMNYLVAMTKTAKKEAKGVPVMLHLDHGDSFKVCKECVDAGFDSIMIDGSKLALDENIKLTREVVDYAHSKGVFVEAELGKLAGVEDAVSNKTSKFTDPKEAARFVKETGCDSLAISIGTSHGAVKFRPDEKPELDFKRLSEIKKEVEAILPENLGKKLSDPNWKQYPFVLHGASSAPTDLVAWFNKSIVMPRAEYEGLVSAARSADNGLIESAIKMTDRHAGLNIGKGVPEEMYSEAVQRGIAKVNVDTDFRLGYMGTIKNTLAEIDPVAKEAIDPRTYGKPTMKELQQIGERKTDMLRSSGKAAGATKEAKIASKLDLQG